MYSMYYAAGTWLNGGLHKKICQKTDISLKIHTTYFFGEKDRAVVKDILDVLNSCYKNAALWDFTA